jgi:hypothetical protein
MSLIFHVHAEEATPNEAKKNNRKMPKTSQDMSMDFLLYLSDLTVVKDEFVGPLDMSQNIQSSKESKSALAAQKKPDSNTEQSEKVK